jgi:trehalose-6-phosphate synthase
LAEALIVNPYDTTTAMADALQRALTMPEREQRDRMRLMRELIRERNIYRWRRRCCSTRPASGSAIGCGSAAGNRSCGWH